MLRRYRFALRPGWLLLHLFTVAAVITMILLGRWQLEVSNSKHFDLQNFGYTIQWWLFAGFALFFWWRIVRDADAHRVDDETPPTPAETEEEVAEPVAYRRYVMPAASDPNDDPELRAYNDYLARINASANEEQT